MRTAFLLSGLMLVSVVGAAEPPIDFRKEVYPILTASCMECHGPNAKARKANLRFDTKLAYTDPTLFTPGRSDKSDFYQRLITNNHRQKMPPPNYKSQLTPKQLTLLKNWIDQGVKHDLP